MNYHFNLKKGRLLLKAHLTGAPLNRVRLSYTIWLDAFEGADSLELISDVLEQDAPPISEAALIEVTNFELQKLLDKCIVVDGVAAPRKPKQLTERDKQLLIAYYDVCVKEKPDCYRHVYEAATAMTNIIVNGQLSIDEAILLIRLEPPRRGATPSFCERIWTEIYNRAGQALPTAEQVAEAKQRLVAIYPHLA